MEAFICDGGTNWYDPWYLDWRRQFDDIHTPDYPQPPTASCRPPTRIYAIGAGGAGNGQHSRRSGQAEILSARPGSSGRPAIQFKSWSGVRSPDGTRWFALIVCDNRRDVAALLADPALVSVDREITPRAKVDLLLRGVSPLVSLDRLRVRVP